MLEERYKLGAIIEMFERMKLSSLTILLSFGLGWNRMSVEWVTAHDFRNGVNLKSDEWVRSGELFQFVKWSRVKAYGGSLSLPNHYIEDVWACLKCSCRN